MWLQGIKRPAACGEKNAIFFRGRLGIVILVLVLWVPSAVYSNDRLFQLAIPAQDVVKSLDLLAEETASSLFIPSAELGGIRANAVQGLYSLQDALHVLLEGTSLNAVVTSRGVIAISMESDGALLNTNEGNKMKINKKSFWSFIGTLFIGTSSVNAQDSSNDIEEVVVTGIRASIISSADEKRKASSIVDTLSSEDIGKFPDSNLAEALQRVPGVSIDRSSGGEGRFVTVRGFGPSFNKVLVNGRTIATTEPTRAFSFDTLAPELVGGTQVYKSAPAFLQSGGIGSTINISTVRPLDKPGSKFIGSVALTNEDLSGETTPQIFAFASNTWADDSIGGALSISYQEREVRQDIADTGGYVEQPNLLSADPNDTYLFPRNFDLINNIEERERLGVVGVLQFKPSETLEILFDVIYSDFTVKSTANSLGFFNANSSLTAVNVNSEGVVDQFTTDNSRSVDYITRSFNRPTESTAIGLTFNWQATESLKATLDISQSDAEDKNGGNEFFLVAGFNDSVTYDATSGGLPNVTSSILGSDNFASAAAANLQRGHFVTRQGRDRVDEISEVKLDIDWSLDGVLTAVNAGVAISDQAKDNNLIETSGDVWCLYCGYNGPADPALFTTSSTQSGFLSGAPGNAPSSFLVYDAEAYLAYLESPAALSALDAATILEDGTIQPDGTSAATLATNPFGPGFSAGLKADQSFSVEEETTSFYVQADFQGDLWQLLAGVRYTETETTAIGTQANLLDLRAVPADNTIYDIQTSDSGLTTVTADYDETLPSLNFRYNFSDDFILRAAYSKSLTRPTLTDLAPRISFDTNRPGNLQASSGNPALTPFLSDNFDLGVEYYFGEGSYFSAAYFDKDISDFIASGLQAVQFPIANADGIADADANNNVTYQVSLPVNIDDLTVDGVELALAYAFTDAPGILSNMGVLVNATVVDSSETEESTLVGAGDSQNLVVYYDDSQLELRLAYNNRDEFVSTLVNASGGRRVLTEDYSQLDFRASYRIGDNYQISFDAINIAGEELRRKGPLNSEFLRFEETGPRYSIGLRAEF